MSREQVKEAFSQAVDLMYQDLATVGQPPVVDPDPDTKPKPSGTFKLYHQMRYKNQPDLRKFGPEPLPIIYQKAFFDGDSPDKKSTDPAKRYKRASESKTKALAKKASGLTVIDIEAWWTGNGAAMDPRAIDNFVEVLEWWKEAGGPPVGYYSTIPIRNWKAPIEGGSRFATWQKANDMLRPVGRLVDATFPSCYTFYEDEDPYDGEGWEKYNKFQISEAKRIAPDADCFVYLWPEYHNSNDEREGDPIEPGFMRGQLEACVKNGADGVVFWTHSSEKNVDFKDIPPWWDEVVDFAKDHDLAS